MANQMNQNEKNVSAGKWSRARIIRLVLGLGATVFGIVAHENILITLGIWLLLQGLLNMSCCCGGSCASNGQGDAPLSRQVKRYDPKA